MGLWNLLLFCLHAVAAEPEAAAPAPEPAPAPAAPPTPPTPEERFGAINPLDLFGDAITRREQGDLAGAEERLRFLEQRSLAETGQPSADVMLELGIIAEVRERYDEALAAYAQVRQGWPDSRADHEAAFRQALVYNDLGRHAEARDALSALRKRGYRGGEDGLLLALERGRTEVGLGRTRKGTKRIQRALDQAEGHEELTWMRARARATLMRVILDEAAAIPLQDPARAADDLSARRLLINQAEAQRAAITELGEPEYVLDALAQMGDAALALYDAVNASPPPPGLASDAAAVALFHTQVAEESERFRQVAWHYYDAGVELARRLRWEGSLTEALEVGRAKLAGLPGYGPPPPAPVASEGGEAASDEAAPDEPPPAPAAP